MAWEGGVDAAPRAGLDPWRQPVKEIGPASVAGWVETDAEIDGATKRGVVKAGIDGLPSLREALVAEAIKDSLRFGQGQGFSRRLTIRSFCKG